MKFTEWLESELAALDELDKIEAGLVPPHPVLFRKRDGTPFMEFIEFVKRDADGAEHHLIANAGGLDLYERHQAEALDVEALAEAVSKAAGQVAALSKRVDVLAQQQADLVEVQPADLAALLSEAVAEAEGA